MHPVFENRVWKVILELLELAVETALEFGVVLNVFRIYLSQRGGDAVTHLIVKALLLRLIVVLLLLLGTDRLFCTETNMLRSIGAAAAETLCRGVVMFVLPYHFRYLGVIISFFVLGGIAFGTSWRKWGIYGLLLGAVSSFAQAMILGRMIPALLAVIGVWAISAMSRNFTQLVPIEIQGFGKRIQLTGLRDTGNKLTDPISGESVVVISAAAAYRLTGLSQKELADPLDTMCKSAIVGLRLIPYCAIGQKNGLLLALRYPYVKIGRYKSSYLIAFAPEGLEGQNYQALLGGMI